MIQQLLVALTGGLSKIYDDFIVDNHIIKNEYIQSLIVGLIFILHTYIFINDCTFGIVLFVMYIVNYIADPYAFNNSILLSLLTLAPFILLLGYKTASALSFIDILIFIGFCICMYIENKLITEDVSIRKLIYRIFVLIVNIGFIFLNMYLQLSPSIINVYIYSTAYVVISVLFQAYSLFINDSSH